MARKIPQLDRFFRHGKLNLQKRSVPVPGFLVQLSRLTVPKSWFGCFYVIFLILMCYLILGHWNLETSSSSMKLLWTLLTIQAMRRTAESLFLTKWGSKSHMHVSHFIVGIAFYVLVPLIAFSGVDGDDVNGNGVGFMEYSFAIAFLIFSFDQYRNHLHLSKLIKYTVPSSGLFSVVSCAHYFDEVALYGIVVCLSFAIAPWSAQSISFLFMWCFVLVNLSISAKQSRLFYLSKFSDYLVEHSIIPYVY